mgnify:CR=1 FL=1
MRGKQDRAGGNHGIAGLIPAHTGKTMKGPRSSASWWAHPRSCGENRDGIMEQIVSVGSSPLTRGKLGNRLLARVVGGLIPAHAGKTLRLKASPHKTPAHPRSCGENQAIRMASLASLGSSPLTRGKRVRCLDRQTAERLIPAHAGKTTTASHSARAAGAHPHSCGEHSPCSASYFAPWGSSPLTRGKHEEGRR